MKAKKFLSFLILFTLLLSLCISGAAAAETDTSLAVFGDVDGNGTVDATDYIMVKRHVLGTYRLDWQQLCKADVNLDAAVNAADYIMLKRTVLGTYRLTTPVIQPDTGSLSDEELCRQINAMLYQNRVQGELLVFLPDGCTEEDAARIFSSVGLSDDLQDTSVYSYRSDRDETLQSDTLWFVVCVPEEQIREVLFSMIRHEEISAVTLNYIGSWV